MAEREGFEPPDPFRSTVFKTAALNHSAISPRWGNYTKVFTNHNQEFSYHGHFMLLIKIIKNKTIL